MSDEGSKSMSWLEEKKTKWLRMWTLTAGERLRYGGGIAALVVASCFMYLVPLVPQVIIDGVIAIDDAGEPPSGFVTWAVNAMGGRETVADRLWIPAAIIAVFTTLAGVFTYLRGRWSAQAAENIAVRVRDELYDHLQHLPCSYHDQAETGDLVQRCTSDVETLRLFLSTQIVEIGRAIIMLLIPLPLMFALNVPMTFASIVLVPAIVAFSMIYFRKVKAAFKEMDEAEGSMNARIQENLTGIRVVRAFARQEFENERFAEKNETHRDLDNYLYKLAAKFWGTSDLLCFGQKGIVVALGGYWLAIGTLQVGEFYFFLAVVSMFVWPVRMMGRILTELGKALVALDRIKEILDAERETDPDLTPATTPSRDLIETLAGDIIFDNVTFSHDGQSPALEQVSFKIPQGETLAILGPSGSGKSTIVNLLLRFYDSDDGSIRMGEHQIATLPREIVRSQIAVVMQEPFLYSKTLRENISLGHPNATDEEIIEATTISAVHDSIESFDGGYDTTVGERGVTLSGGQRQRVALARALLQDPTLLILDDALSAIDTGTESEIIDALEQRHGRQSTIIIAHRLSSVMHADRIIVLDHGRIIQAGSHDELIEAEGLYQRLWQIQSSLGASGNGTSDDATSDVTVRQERTETAKQSN